MRSPLPLLVVVLFSVNAALPAHEPDVIVDAEPPALKAVPVYEDVPASAAPQPQANGKSLEHLLKAAAHLQAAGLTDEAAALMQQVRARVISDDVIARKETELQCLQNEIDQLRTLTGQSQSIIVSLAAVEVHRGKLGGLGGELDRLLGSKRGATKGPAAESALMPASGLLPDDRNPTSILEENPLRNRLFQQLKAEGMLSVLAEPTVLCSDSRPTSFLQGGQFAVKQPIEGGLSAVQWVSFGVQGDCMATVRPANRVRLQINFEISGQDLNLSRTIDGESIPGLTCRRINTEVELSSGQTAVAFRLVKSNPQTALVTPRLSESPAGAPRVNDETEFIVFVTPEIGQSNVSRPAADLTPLALDPDEIRRLLSPAGVPDDVQYFPTSPIPRRGTLR